MNKTLIEITLKEPGSFGKIRNQSFNNDSRLDGVRNSFYHRIPHFEFYKAHENKVPPKYRFSNVHHYNSNEICTSGDNIIVGEYCDEGIVVPKRFSIAFNKLYNCSPLISLIRGDEEYISFLHTWAIADNSEVVDKQVKHWLQTVTKFGEISETVFAPRKNAPLGADTAYQNAIQDITEISQKTIVLTRDIIELSGIVNGMGVYFNGCGYHLWKR